MAVLIVPEAALDAHVAVAGRGGAHLGARHGHLGHHGESVLVAALVSALGCVAAAIARSNGFDLARYEEFVANHFARVFQPESARPVYH